MWVDDYSSALDVAFRSVHTAAVAVTSKDFMKPSSLHHWRPFRHLDSIIRMKGEQLFAGQELSRLQSAIQDSERQGVDSSALAKFSLESYTKLLSFKSKSGRLNDSGRTRA